MLKNFEEYKKTNKSSINEKVNYEKYPYYTKENVEQYPEYLKELDTLIKKLDITLGSLWSNVSSLSIADILGGTEDFNELGKSLQSTMRRYSELYRKVSNSIHNVLTKEEYEEKYSNPELGIILDEMNFYINDKADLLDEIYELYDDMKKSMIDYRETQTDLMAKSDIFDSNNTASIIEIHSPDIES